MSGRYDTFNTSTLSHNANYLTPPNPYLNHYQAIWAASSQRPSGAATEHLGNNYASSCHGLCERDVGEQVPTMYM